jgi:hypothetical protein
MQLKSQQEKPPRRVLVLAAFSQTGQLRDVVESVVSPLRAAAGIELVERVIEPAQKPPFPWPFMEFFDAFPEAVHEVAPALVPLPEAGGGPFDLVVLAYQVWFLSPAPAMTAFLQSDRARAWIAGAPVMTVVACRNMWLMAQERMRARIRDLGGHLVDHVALTDSAPSAATFVSTPAWLLTGTRGPFLRGLVPAAGISTATIAAASRFGRALAAALPTRSRSDQGPMLAGLGAVRINERLIASERIARRSFLLWGALLRKSGPPGAFPRRCLLAAYILFLVSLIGTVVPVSALIKRLAAPLFRRQTALQKAYYAAPSGEGVAHMSPAV